MINLENKKVLLTGAGSLINRPIARRLKQRGAIVHEVFHRDCDLLNKAKVDEVFWKNPPDFCIHGAGFNGGIEYNKLYPKDIMEKTIVMGMNVLDACVKYKTQKTVILLTSCSYPSKSGQLTEDEFLNAPCDGSVECHGWAKRLVFMYGKQCFKQEGLISVGVIFNNSYGPKDYFEEPSRLKVLGALIKKIVDAKNNNEPQIVIWGTGKPRREFIYCEDAAEGAVRTLERYDNVNMPINVGCGMDLTIKELAEKICEIVKYNGELVLDTTKQDGQMQKLLCVERMKELLGFYPTVKLEDGIKKTIQYYESLCHVD